MAIWDVMKRTLNGTATVHSGPHPSENEAWFALCRHLEDLAAQASVFARPRYRAAAEQVRLEYAPVTVFHTTYSVRRTDPKPATSQNDIATTGASPTRRRDI